MIGAFYNEAMIAKAQAIVAEGRNMPVVDRDAHCQSRCGLTFEYLRRVGTDFKKPSARTVMNLGYEVYVKDVGTGEFTKLELDVPCDWNPANPRMNPVSTPVFVTELFPESTSSE
jgi:hypothetical protein